MVASPAKKSRTEPGFDEGSRTHIWLNIADAHLNLTISPRSKKSIQACVLYFSDSVRHVQLKIKGSRENEKASIFSVLIADQTGTCMFDAWRNIGESLNAALLEEERKKNSSGGIIYIQLDDIDIQEEGRVKLTPMRKLVTNARTTFQIIQNPEKENMQPPQRLDLSILTSDFTKLKAPPPYQVSLIGVVFEVGQSYLSQNGSTIQKLKVQNGDGKWIQIMAFDRQADHPDFVVGNRLYLFFVSASPGQNNRPGTFWLFNESHVVLAHSNCNVITPGEEITPS